MADPLLPPSLRGDANLAALADCVAAAMPAASLDRLLVYLIDQIPAAALPVLAQQFHADWWDAEVPEWRQRELVAALLVLHRRKGTVWSVREQLTRLGQPDAELIEGAQAHRHDGRIVRDGLWYYDAHPAGWATYLIRLPTPETLDRARQLAAACRAQAPARCRLVRLHYPEASIRYNGAALHDGSYTRGVVDAVSWE
jgi:phage tail P2-like protein